MISTLPKLLLILDEIPQSINAGSIQFYRLLEDYPPDRILIIGKKVISQANLLPVTYLELSYPLVERIHFSRYKPILAKLEALGLVRYQLSKSLENIANAFGAEIVITLLQDLRYYQPAYHYAKKYKLPLCIFCHDDAENFSGLKGYFKKRLLNFNKVVYSFASKRFCISPEMEKAWRKKYETAGDVLYPIPSRDIEAKTYQSEKVLVNSRFLTLGFAGSMAYGYREGIAELLPILHECNCIINIYRDQDSSLQHEKIIFKGYASTPEETWSKIRKECDALLLPYSFDEKFKELYTTHFPSKLCEYLYLGMPIFLRGPSYANGIKWMMDQRPDIKDLKLNIINSDLHNFINEVDFLFHNIQLLELIGQENYKLAHSFFSPLGLRLEFINHIKRVANA